MGKFAPFALLALLLCAPALAARRKSGEPHPIYDEALALYLKGDFRGALPAAEEAIEQAPHKPAAFALRARLWHVFGNYKEMRQDSRRALAEFDKIANPGAEDFIGRGSAQLMLEDGDAALSSFEAALKWPLESVEAVAGKARVFRARAEPKNAIAPLDQAIKDSPQALYYYNRAHAYYDLGLYDNAVADLTSAIRLNKKFHLAFGLLGSTLAKKGDAARALQAYNKAVSLDPDYVYGLLGRAALALAAGKEEDAFRDFDQAAKINPREHTTFLGRADAYLRKGERDQALTDLRKAAASDLPDSASAALIGDRFAELSFWPEAMASYNQARAMKPTASLLIRRARVHEALKEAPQALADLTEATDLEPSLAAAWSAKGLLEMRMNDETGAASDLNRAVKLDPKNPEAFIARGNFFARTGKPNAALDDFNKAIALSPEGAPQAYNDRGALYANAFSDVERALADITKAMELKPKEPVFHFNLGVVRTKGNSFISAIDSFDTALRLKGPVSKVLQFRAQAYSELGRQDLAMKDIQTAIEHDPKNPALYDALAGIRGRSRDYDLSIQDLNQALSLDDKNVRALIDRGIAHVNAGSMKRALSDLRKATEIDPRSKEAFTELCHLQRALKDLKASVKSCSQAIDIDAGYAPAYLHRALTNLQLSDPFKSIQDVEKAGHLGLRRPEGLLAQSIAHAKAKQYQQAHQVYLQAVSLDSNVHSPVVSFGRGRGDMDDYYNAIQDLDSAMESDGADPYVYLVRGDAQSSAAHFDKAIQEYAKAMEADGTFAEAFACHAEALMAQDALDAAQQDLLRAVELSPKEPIHHVRLASLLSARGSYKQAIEQASAALALDPQNADAYIRAGNAYYFLKNYKRALENYTLAAKVDPLSANAYNGIGLANFAQKGYLEALDNFSRSIALSPQSDRFYRNRGSTFTNMKEFSNAAVDFKSASLVNADPALNEEYAGLIKEAEARTGNSGAQN